MSTNNLKTKISDLTKRVNLDGTEVLPLSWEDTSTQRYLSYSVASGELTKYATSYAFSYMEIPKKSERTVVEVWEDDYTPVTLQYNKITEVDADVTTVIPVIIGETNGKEKCEYCLKLNVRDTLPTLTFPSDIVWADDLVLELNTHYIILINYENSGLYADWKSYPLSNAEYSKKYLRTTALSSGHIGFFNVWEESTTVCSISYSKDNGETWSTYTNSESEPEMSIYVDVNPGDEILWKGDIQKTNMAGFSSDVGFNVDGNIMSMRYGDDFIGETTLTEFAFTGLFASCNYLVDAKNLILPAETLAEACYGEMFDGCTNLVNTPELPAETLATECYNGMFQGCTSLTVAPVLPANVLRNDCYTNMFAGCTSLTTAPELPATTLADGCYNNMFSGCTSLTTAPELPATTLAYGCYSNMFQGCTRLTTAPELPATTLVDTCYYSMFSCCTSLKNAPILPASTLVSNCYDLMFYGCSSLNYIRAAFTTTPGTSYTQSWVNGVASTGVFIKNTNALWDLNNEHGVPIGWQTRLDECDKYLCTTALGDGEITFIIHANPTDVNSISYSTDDGANWTTVMNTNQDKDIQDIPVTVNVQTNDKVLWKGVLRRTSYSKFTSTVDFNVSGNIMSLTYSDGFRNKEQIENDKQFAYLFTNTRVVDAHKLYLPSTTSDGCYLYMFNGCSKLTAAPVLQSTKLSQYCYQYMFNNCTSLATAPELPATTLTDYCYQYMFNNCTSLTSAPTLPATTLAQYCYSGMFQGCTSLTTAPALPATTLANTCYWGMFQGCTSLTAAPALPATTLATDCYESMFQGCTSLTTAPALPATTLAAYCYYSMFDGCTKLEDAPALPATTLAAYCYAYIFKGCTSLITAPALPATTLAAYCYAYIFKGCTSLTTAPVLPAEKLIDGCYGNMFNGCSNLNYIDAAFLTTPSDTYTYNWVDGVASTGTFIKNSKATWDVTGVNGVPVNWDIQNGYSKQYLKTTALTNGTIELLFEYYSGYKSVKASKVAYSLDDGQTWTINDWSNPKANLLISIPVSTGDEILWKSDISRIEESGGYFKGTASFNVDGNIMSLSNYDDFVNATTISNENFAGLFHGANVVNAENLVLPIKSLARYCYAYMFQGCTHLETIPKLSATTLADSCYNSMFRGCTHLETIPKLSATTLADSCYNSMFYGCTGITATPALPATTLADSCYNSMFYGCTGITATPALPATTLANLCYGYMFYGCTGITATPALPVTTLAGRCYEGMFQGCTGITTAPALPATTLAEYCYDKMFKGCTSLTTPTALPATTLANYCYWGMFEGCTSLTTAPELPAMTLTVYCYYEMFKGCTSLTTHPALPATTLTEKCYESMFEGCTSLTTAPALPATTLANRCYYSMFRGCTSLTTVPALPATTLANSCYNSMFYGCTSLTTAPELPATTLVSYCYAYMFQGCTSLNYIKAMFTTTPAWSYTSYWVKDVASTGIFVKNSAATWDVTGDNGVPTGWTIQTA